MKNIDILTLILIIVGGLNWGLVGLLNYDLVASIFGNSTFLSNLIYTLVGISAFYQLVAIKSVRDRVTVAKLNNK